MAKLDKRTKTFYKWNGDDVLERAKKLVGKSSFEIGLAVEAQAKALAPVKTGRLAGSIHTVSWDGQSTKPEKQKDTLSTPGHVFETHVGTNLEYATYMEYGRGPFKVNSPVLIPGVGWRYIGMHPGYDAQPFLRPALDIAQGKALSIVTVNSKQYFAEYLTNKTTFSQTPEGFTE